jgi:uncharacterized protein DUF4352/uncharacterized protein DUF2510
MPDEPGWHPDPYFKGWQRFWDGTQWTRQSRRAAPSSEAENGANAELVGASTTSAGASTTATREYQIPASVAPRVQPHRTVIESPVTTAVVPRTQARRTITAPVVAEPSLVGQFHPEDEDDYRSRRPLFGPRYWVGGLAAAIVVVVVVILAAPKSPSTPSAGSKGTGHAANTHLPGHRANANTPAASAGAAVPTPTPSSQSSANPGTVTPTTSPFTGSSQTLATSQAGLVSEQGHPLARLKVTAESVSSSNANGAAPENGYFATFTVKIKDTSATETYNVSPLDFYVSTASDRHFNADDGHGATANSVSGALTSQTLNPGQVVTGTVTIDEPDPHGTFVYAISAAPLDSWSF